MAETKAGEDEVKTFLLSHGLAEYHDKLVDVGYDTISRLKNIVLEDLLDIGMLKGHARKLLRDIAALGDGGEGGEKAASLKMDEEKNKTKQKKK